MGFAARLGKNPSGWHRTSSYWARPSPLVMPTKSLPRAAAGVGIHDFARINKESVDAVTKPRHDGSPRAPSFAVLDNSCPASRSTASYDTEPISGDCKP
jgi:hypothetical protein